MSFSSLCIFWKKLSLILCLNELILFVDFRSEDRLFHIFGPMSSKQKHIQIKTKRNAVLNQNKTQLDKINGEMNGHITYHFKGTLSWL